MANDLPSSPKEEIDEAHSLFPSVRIHSRTSRFVVASYERTPSTRIKFTLTFPEGYPDHVLVVDIDRDGVVPPGLKKKLEKDLGAAASECAGRYDQVRVVWERLTSFVDTNLFVPCWKELKQCVDLIHQTNGQGRPQTKQQAAPKSPSASAKGSTITLSETKGRIKLNLRGGSYHYTCVILINKAYPTTTNHKEWGNVCVLSVESTNFPHQIETMLTSQAREIVRRMQEGLNAERATKMSNPVRLPKNFKFDEKAAHSAPRLTGETLKGIKHDVDTLKQVHDLREIDAKTTVGNARIKANAARERKDARRTISKLTVAERANDREAEDRERNWMADEQKRLTGYDMHDGADPQPSLLVLVTFLMEKIRRLPEERCPRCEERALPTKPGDLDLIYGDCHKTDAQKAARKRRPMRTYCGCWYHKSCLNTFMVDPPFGASCPTEGCGRRVFHPDYPGDIKHLEREWAAREARKREIEDAMFF